MHEHLRTLAKTIRENQENLRLNIAEIRSNHSSEFIKSVNPIPISLSICAVDGGLLSHRMHGIDIAFARAVGVHFFYQNSKLASHNYHPSRSPESSLEIKHALDDHEANVFRSLVRLKHELNCAIETVEKFSPQLMLMDGSLLLVPSDRPSNDSELYPDYKSLIELYSKLYSICETHSCDLIGVIKDSRSTRFSKQFGFACSDTLFANYFLDAAERTIEFQYLDEKVRELNKDLAPIADRISYFYLKSSELDLPLRIEVLNSDKSKTTIEEKASLIHSLSSVSKAFAYPAILVEADMCAAMDAQEIEIIENLLVSANVKPLRRNSRPFR